MEKTYRRIEVDQMEKEGVPPLLQRAVAVLNEALLISDGAVKACLDTGIALSAAEAVKFLEHPSIIVRGPEGTYRQMALSGLGLIAGCVNEGEFRLSVHEEDDGTWTTFGVMKVQS